MENKIPTAEEYLNDYYPEEDDNQMLTREQARRVMRGFAGLHREAILKAAAEEAAMTTDSWASLQEGTFMEIDKQSILLAYPPYLIK